MTRPTATATSKPDLRIDLNAVSDDEESSILPEPIIVPVAPIAVSKFDLSSVTGYSQKRASMKQQAQIRECVAELKHALAIFDSHEIQLNHSLVLFVSQIVEDIFTKPGLGSIKRDIVVEVCKEYFNNNTDLVHMVIDLIFEKIIKTSFFRRNKSRVVSLFFWVSKQFGANCDVRLQTNFKTSLGR